MSATNWITSTSSRPVTSSRHASFTVPGITLETGGQIADVLQEWLASLVDLVYGGVIGAHRQAMGAVGEQDRVTEDLLIGQTGVLERYHWFVRSHLADWAGGMANAGASSEVEAASSVATKSRARLQPASPQRR